jgi:hypothetical protein
VAELGALVLALKETLLDVALVVAATAIVVELVLLVLVMLMVTIVAIVASSVQPVAPALGGKMMQFAFVAHTLRQLMSLQQ